jgi:hypothetical protein
MRGLKAQPERSTECDSLRTVQEPKTGPLEHFQIANNTHICRFFNRLQTEFLEKTRTPSARWAVKLWRNRG